MQSIAINDLKNSPTTITNFLEQGIPVFLTKNSKPIAITVPIDDSIVNQSIKELLLFDLYQTGEISFGKLSELLNVSKEKLRNMFATLNMPVINYSPDEIKAELKLLSE